MTTTALQHIDHRSCLNLVPTLLAESIATGRRQGNSNGLFLGVSLTSELLDVPAHCLRAFALLQRHQVHAFFLPPK